MTSVESEAYLKRTKLQSILEKDDERRGNLLNIYEEIKAFISSHQDDCLETEIHARFPKYRDSLETEPTDLHEDERPLLVTGECSSGKSSFINLLLGFDILPVGVLPTTGVVCRIRSSEKKKVEVFEKGQTLCHNLSVENEKELKKKLAEVISPTDKGRREANSVEYVDIYWPIPFLRKNIMVVDTPGVGESKEMTERVTQYLPKAVGLIYVIDPTRAGGLATDRIVPLIKGPVSGITDDIKQKFDPACALFVCNKWDQVQGDNDDDDDEAEKVFQHVKSELEALWPKFDVKQLHCISTHKALKRRKKGKSPPKEVIKFVDEALMNLVEHSVGAKSRSHIQWLQRFLEHIYMCLNTHLKSTSLTISQREEQLKEADKLLKQLEDRCSKTYQSLNLKVIDECGKFTKAVYYHIKEEKNITKMFSWKDAEHPDGGDDMDIVREKADRIIRDKVMEELKSVLEQYGGLETMNNLDEMLKEEVRQIEEMKLRLEVILQPPKSEDKIDCSDMEKDEEGSSSDDNTSSVEKGSCSVDEALLASRGEKIAVVLTAPVWIPMAAVAGVIAMTGVGFVVAKRKFEVWHYKSNKSVYMDKWSREVLSQINEHEIYKTLKEKFYDDLLDKIEKHCKQDAPQIIESWKTLLLNLQKDTRTNKEIVERYEPLFVKCRQIRDKVNDLV